MTDSGFDRREQWQAAPRPEWMQTINALGDDIDARGTVPLSSASLVDQAMAGTGLSDFGNGAWKQHFDTLMEAIESEARLHLAGRILTRADMLIHLEGRLRVAEAYRQHRSIAHEDIGRPLMITGYGRSGTTILLELLALDPRFRVVERWEALFPDILSHERNIDPERLRRTEAHDTLLAAMTPEFQKAHKSAARLPVESLELEYPSFLSDIYPILYQIPSYARYLHEMGNREAIQWQRTILRLLQHGREPKRWLLKSPSHLPHLPTLLETFPGMQVIFTHRDPVASADSIVSVMGTLYWLRTDHPWGTGSIESASLSMSEERARQWDGPIELVESGRLGPGDFANFHYAQFLSDPAAAIRAVYRDLSMEFDPEVERKMLDYLAAKPQGKFGRHDYAAAPGHAIERERAAYRKYERFFDVARER